MLKNWENGWCVRLLQRPKSFTPDSTVWICYCDKTFPYTYLSEKRNKLKKKIEQHMIILWVNHEFIIPSPRFLPTGDIDKHPVESLLTAPHQVCLTHHPGEFPQGQEPQILFRQTLTCVNVFSESQSKESLRSEKKFTTAVSACLCMSVVLCKLSFLPFNMQPWMALLKVHMSKALHLPKQVTLLQGVCRYLVDVYFY